MGSNSTPTIIHLKNLPIGTKFKCKIGPIDEWRMYEKNNVKYVCPNDDSKNMTNRNWELNEFCNVFNDREIEVIEIIADNIVEKIVDQNIIKEYKVDDIITFDEIKNLPEGTVIVESPIHLNKCGKLTVRYFENKLMLECEYSGDLFNLEYDNAHYKHLNYRIINIGKNEIRKNNNTSNKKEYKVDDVVEFDEIKNLPTNSIIKSIYSGCYYLKIPRGISMINIPNIYNFNDTSLWSGDEFRIITLGYK